MIIKLITGRLEIEANRSGKFTAFLQIVCVLSFIAVKIHFCILVCGTDSHLCFGCHLYKGRDKGPQ